MKKDCAFQYYNGGVVKVDVSEITIDEAKQLWNENYADMVKRVEDGHDIEVAIWINMEYASNYHETLVYLSSPQVKNRQLWEPKYYGKYETES